MKIVSTVSLKAGTGRTTLSVTLGHALAERARTVLFELDPQNTLGLHLGMAIDDTRGLATPDFDRAEAVERRDGGRPDVPFVPFGSASASARLALESSLLAEQGWLERRIEELCPDGTEFVVLDTPAGRGPWQDAALRVADVALVVLGADPLCYALLPQMEQVLRESQRPNGSRRSDYFVINRIDTRRALSRDIRDAMAHILGEQLLSVALVEDEAVREAVAYRETALLHAPHSQFVASVRELAQRFAAELS